MSKTNELFRLQDEDRKMEKLRRAKRLAKKLIGKNYFTDMEAVVLEAAIELSERNEQCKQ
mgnify:CR=1 FL=1